MHDRVEMETRNRLLMLPLKTATYHHLLSETRSLTGSQSLQIRLNWLARKHQGSSCLHLPSEVKNTHPIRMAYYVSSGDLPLVLTLVWQVLADSIISAALPCKLISKNSPRISGNWSRRSRVALLGNLTESQIQASITNGS